VPPPKISQESTGIEVTETVNEYRAIFSTRENSKAEPKIESGKL
jgi:hypothetical protein